MSETTELALYSAKGKKVGSAQVPATVFACEPATHLLHQVVRWQRAKRRAGTHSVLTRSGVRGGGKKPWRQKGLGRARAGSSSSPIWVGGGVAHGPKPRSYEFNINKKERKKALCSALSVRANEGNCIVAKDLGLKGEIKTKTAATALKALGVDKTALVVSKVADEVLAKSVRNIKGINVVPVEGLNVYAIMNAQKVVVLEDALGAIGERLQ